MYADGYNVRLLRRPGYINSPARWSPDGTQLVFSTSRYGKSIQNIYIINVDDATERALVSGGLSADFPAWSPDGKTIAYVSHDIYTINIDDSDRRNVTNSKFSYITNVGWSPDSKSMAFLGTVPSGR